jgi:hypothetical protein
LANCLQDASGQFPPNLGGHFELESGGHFKLELGGHFKLELGGQYDWNLHLYQLKHLQYSIFSFQALFLKMVGTIKLVQYKQSFLFAYPVDLIDKLKLQSPVILQTLPIGKTHMANLPNRERTKLLKLSLWY